ncbi:MAG: HXXEE domain-containing protein [Bacteriovoracaceae bacterium]|jgi:hypothetical protein|nr:HXXEE domain-containing protein [Bacteriovoracaceae bacterium]
MSISKTIPYPKAGILSSMVITLVTAALAIIVGLFVPVLAQRFNASASSELVNSFLISIVLMVAHKLESYFTNEYDHCPVYLHASTKSWGQKPRQAVFVGFVGTFLAMAFINYLLVKGPPWTLLILAAWASQGLHELHHSAKSLAQKSYYPGTITSIIFVAYGASSFFPKWSALVNTGGHDITAWYYAVMPFIFVGFYFEHKWWLKKKGQVDCKEFVCTS